MAPVVNRASPLQGYDWVVEQLHRQGFSHLGNELEMAKAMHFMANKEFDAAIAVQSMNKSTFPNGLRQGPIKDAKGKDIYYDSDAEQDDYRTIMPETTTGVWRPSRRLKVKEE